MRLLLIAFLVLCFITGVGLSSPVLANESLFVWPAEGKVCLRFQEKYEVDGVMRTHWGIDIKAPAGSYVYAASSGVVSFSGFTPAGGNTISIVHAEGLKTTYLQLEKLFVAEGEKVVKGEKIGTLAATGDKSSDFPHLHFGVIEVESGKYLNPEDFLPTSVFTKVEEAEGENFAPASSSSLSVPLSFQLAKSKLEDGLFEVEAKEQARLNSKNVFEKTLPEEKFSKVFSAVRLSCNNLSNFESKSFSKVFPAKNFGLNFNFAEKTKVTVCLVCLSFGAIALLFLKTVREFSIFAILDKSAASLVSCTRRDF